MSTVSVPAWTADGVLPPLEILAATKGRDDDLTEAVAGTDPRVANAIRGFVDKLVGNEAVCAMEYRDRGLVFDDVALVRRGSGA